jgi:hypothetical protein
MTTFQLDQNVNRRSFAENCQKEGRAGVWRFPSAWSKKADGFKDPELLPIVMSGDKPLITNDRNIARLHVDSIPGNNPGILIVGFCKGTIRPIGSGDIEKLIAIFKNNFPDWDTVSWSNSVVEITQQGVEVWHVDNGTLPRDLYVEFDDSNWQQLLKDALVKNNRRNPSPPGPKIIC